MTAMPLTGIVGPANRSHPALLIRNGRTSSMHYSETICRRRFSLFRTLLLVLLLSLAVQPLLAGSYPAVSQPVVSAEWKTVSGDWSVQQGTLTGRQASADWGIVLSDDWYGDFEITGKIVLKRASGSDRLVSIVFRSAGRSESYAIVIDSKTGRAHLEETHLGQSRQSAAVAIKTLVDSRFSFRIQATGKIIAATIWPEAQANKEPIRLESSNVRVPEGRVGFGVKNCEATFTITDISGRTESAFPIYAFRCNYRLPDKLSKEPLWRYLDAIASSHAARSSKRFTSVTEFNAYRTSTLAHLRRSLGLDPWPERTPLNARTVGVVERADFKIEKVIFESHPGFYVNALLYLPKPAGSRIPGVLSTIGHYGDAGFFIWSEQSRCIALARKGYAVLTYDPISQGERAWLGRGNHDTLRRKTILAGMEVSGLMVWDSMRAIDYLTSRPEVNPEAIGITGVSGGGFNSLYTAILDERVKAVAPAGFSTTMEALVKRGYAGCCAYLPNLTLYADYPELYSLIAPRKLLLLGGYQDILSDRILDIYEAARNTYALYSAEGNLRYFLDPDGGHIYSRPMRIELYRWFNKWLKNSDDPEAAREPVETQSMVASKESGLLKVFTQERPGRRVEELLKEYVAKNRRVSKLPSSPEEVKEFQAKLRTKLLELMGEMEPDRTPRVISESKSTGSRGSAKVLLRIERDLAIPLEIDNPSNLAKSRGLIIYLSLSDQSRGKEQLKTLVDQGFIAAYPQVRGSGPTLATGMDSIALYSMALGKHLFSIRVYDLQCVMDYLLGQQEYKRLPIVVWGEGSREGLMALYLAAIDPRVQMAISSNGLINYEHLIEKETASDFDYYVPGILQYADVPEIIGLIAPRRVIISSPRDIDGKSPSLAFTGEIYDRARSVYKTLGREAAFSVVDEKDLKAAIATQQ